MEEPNRYNTNVGVKRFIIEKNSKVGDGWTFFKHFNSLQAANIDLRDIRGDVAIHTHHQFRIYDNKTGAVFIKSSEKGESLMDSLEKIETGTPKHSWFKEEVLDIKDVMKHTYPNPSTEGNVNSIQFIGGPLDGMLLHPLTGSTMNDEDSQLTKDCQESVPEGFQHHYKMFPEWSGFALIYLGVKPNGYKHSKRDV